MNDTEDQIEENQSDAVEENQSDAVEEPAAENTDLRQQAERMGWRPKDEWHGDPDQWRDYDEFVERAENNAALAVKNNRRLQEKLSQMEKDMKVQTEMHEMALKAQRKRLEKEFDQRIESAVKDGDIEEYHKLSKERDEELKAFDKPGKQESQTQQEPPEVVEFRKNNEWYGSNDEMTSFAEAMSQSLAQSSPNLPVDVHLEKVRNSVERAFPDHFEKTQNVADVEGGRRRMNGKRNEKKNRTFAAMPQANREAAQRCLDLGFIQKLDDYVENYWDSVEQEN